VSRRGLALQTNVATAAAFPGRKDADRSSGGLQWLDQPSSAIHPAPVILMRTTFMRKEKVRRLGRALALAER
jgi:hypothetical protein